MNRDTPDFRNRSIVFISICIIFLILFFFCCFPVFNRTISEYEKHGSQHIKPDRIEIFFESPVEPGVSDYVLISMKATNTGDVEHPYGSLAINLGDEIIDGRNVYSIRERVKFHVDGLNHRYFVPIGENRYHMYEWGLEQNRLKENIESLIIEIPDIEGVNIDIEKIEFKKRNFFALDSYINYFLKNNLNTGQLNRYLTPAYIFLIAIVVLYGIFVLVFRNINRKNSLIKNNRRGPEVSTKNRSWLAVVTVSTAIIILTGFSFYFIKNYFYTTKSYWDSYKTYITTGDLRNTYKGFYNFEDFILWLDKKIPEDKNLIVLLKGEPVYIMAEMAYNLYPRDIRYIDIAGKNMEQVTDEIKTINSENDNSYNYLAALTEEDFFSWKDLSLIDSFGESGGFLFYWSFR